MDSPAQKFRRLCEESRAVWMGIINATPDSFSDGGNYPTIEAALQRARELVTHGATILDVGGVSTRPGSVAVSPEEEMRRIEPLLMTLRNTFNSAILLSVDTFRPTIAQSLAERGLCDIVNDVSGATHSEINKGSPLTTADVASQFKLGIILMHMQGTPETMQRDPVYKDCVAEVSAFLAARAEFAKNVGCSAIVLDPGIGFGKRFEDNRNLLAKEGIKTLTALGFPLLVGLSRKRFLQQWFAHTGEDLSNPKDRDRHSKELERDCIAFGAKIIRSHTMPSEPFSGF